MTKYLNAAAAVTLGSFLAPGFTVPALAADADAAAESTSDASGGTGGEIVVTSLKRAIKLQDAPASITSISDDTLRAASIDSANDLVRAVPSLTITDAGPGQRRITLRGIRSAGDAQVGIYYDETPVAGPPGTTSDPGGSQSDFKLFDLERVEVLRGPQGTLYGAGAVGGTIRLVTRKPDFEFGGRVDVGATTTEGGGEGYQLNAALNVPIVKDVLAVRGVYFRRQNDGWVDNPGLGLTGINSERSDGGRILVRFVPTPGLTIDGAAHFLYSEGGASTWSPSAGKYNAVNSSQVPYSDKQRLYSLSARAELGLADLVATTSYQDRDTLVTRDPTPLFRSFKTRATCATHFTAAVCATPAGFAAYNSYVDGLLPVIYYQPQSVTDWTNELRLQSNGSSWFQWTLGGFYEDRDSKVLSEARRTNASDGSQIQGATPLLQRHVIDKLKQKAAFGEIAVTPVEGLTLTGGLRYYSYDKTVGGDTTIGLDILRTAVTPFAVYKTKNNGWLYKANASWKAADNVLVYGQVATGYRPGGVNQVLGLAQALSYSPDKLTTYEGGIKTSFGDDALILNLSAYLTDWSDMQVSINSGSFLYLGNAGAARIKGVEAEATLNPTRGLVFNVNAVLTDAKLTEDQVPDGVTPLASTARRGDKIPFIAPQTISFAGQYEWALGSGGWNGLVRGDLTYVGSSRADFRPTSASYRKVGDYALANTRVGVRGDRYGVFFYVNNLLNKAGRTSAGNTLGGTTETVTTIPPRTYGINLTGSF
ncbi:TonB-dependent receptor [Novosphingobium sp. AP12]|uniref:TonB-dependent receptor n=1 Tax=Novosphingobium sp. AP12 TaxID=1144305 RepID=UPI000271F106|nr:TonB-dependent receptor [Novosphingobium sp. AP12]EJL34354.1 outer membrane receptor for ferrienterochelin and colicin [Novosphingobium sp. AP12]